VPHRRQPPGAALRQFKSEETLGAANVQDAHSGQIGRDGVFQDTPSIQRMIDTLWTRGGRDVSGANAVPKVDLMESRAKFLDLGDHTFPVGHQHLAQSIRGATLA
jgi:hypothetical protein